ncbi:hypothetical protein LguiA_030712 [Lonicera macranthoides]
MSSRVSNSVYAQPLIFLLVTLLNLVHTTANHSGNMTDSLALLAFRSNLHDPQGVLNSWNHSVHFCNWQGVTCGRLHRRVTVLNLQSSGLSGSLSPYIGNLSFLKELTLQNNSFEGEIPNEIGHLSRLKRLFLYNNSIEGKIPANLSQCTSLEFLSVANNKLVGEMIPRELSSLSRLKKIAVSGNNLRGEIPNFIKNLTSLEILYASSNFFEGSIPNTLGELRNLKEIQFSLNKLSGTLPSSIYNLSSLTFISMARNELGGTLPQDLGLRLPHLQELQMWENHFSGTIPLSLSNASELAIIVFANNNFTGKVPNFGSLKNLMDLGLDDNYLGTREGDDMNMLIDSLTNCSLLEKFSVMSNNLGGSIPNSVGNLSTQLREFAVVYNQISGSIPSGFSNLVNLERIQMGYNMFEGQIPNDIGKLQKLRHLHLSSNQLLGLIPFSLGNMSFLSLLLLQDNKLEGTIPSSLGNCKNLLYLDLSQNNLSSTIPKELFDASALSVLLCLSNNRLVGPIPSEVGKLKNLAELDVSENLLSGAIPYELGSCTLLVDLYLGGNIFQGSIPPTLKSLRGFQNLDLSNNNLSGTIPIFLEKLSLKSLNLSFNDFEGELPTQGVFANASAISVLGNRRLCGGVSELRLTRCKMTTSNRRKLSHLHIIIIAVVCSILAVLMVSLFIFCWTKNRRKVQSSQSFVKKSFLKVSYGDLFKATNGFSSTNIIGLGSFGSVYKGILDQDEMVVAVKVLNLQHYGASKSFKAECKALRNIRHRNLVKIITSCSSIDFNGNDFKALVYEFMPNGSLERWLHSNQENLSLGQRIGIAIDVAFALDYLHHQCGKPIIHCDLKPSNVLLDANMVAHVGDFGLAKFSIPESANANQSQSVGVKGTIGYAAPEYGLGNEVSTNGDIYSYGILLLEMMTGISPIDPMFSEGLNLHNYAKAALPNNVRQIVEPRLLCNDEEGVEQVAATNMQINGRERSINDNRMGDCVVSVVKIGVACSMESPQDRMDLNDVIHQLQLIKSTLGGS